MAFVISSGIELVDKGKFLLNDLYMSEGNTVVSERRSPSKWGTGIGGDC